MIYFYPFFFNYSVQMDIEETTRRLRQGDFGQNLDPSERSKLLK